MDLDDLSMEWNNHKKKLKIWAWSGITTKRNYGFGHGVKSPQIGNYGYGHEFDLLQ